MTKLAPEKQQRKTDTATYKRIPVETHLIGVKEPLDPIFRDQVKPLIKPGDWIAISEKVVTISQEVGS